MKRKYSLKLVMENYLNEKTYDIESSTQDSIRGDEESIKGRSMQTDKEARKTYIDDTDEGTIKDPKNGELYDYSHEFAGTQGPTPQGEGESKIGKNLAGQGPYGMVVSNFVRGTEKTKYYIVKNGKKIFLRTDDYSDYLKELMKATGISKEGIMKINKLIMNSDLPGAKELDKATKSLSEQSLQESLSRGSLYRKKYFGRH